MNKIISQLSVNEKKTDKQTAAPFAHTNSDDILFDFSDLNVGDTGFVAQCEGQNQQRLMVLGLTPSTPFSVVRVAPLGDPVEISFRGFSLTLRRNELKGIKVKKS